MRISYPAGINGSARCTHGSAQHIGQLTHRPEALRAAHATPARDNDARVRQAHLASHRVITCNLHAQRALSQCGLHALNCIRGRHSLLRRLWKRTWAKRNEQREPTNSTSRTQQLARINRARHQDNTVLHHQSNHVGHHCSLGVDRGGRNQLARARSCRRKHCMRLPRGHQSGQKCGICLHPKVRQRRIVANKCRSRTACQRLTRNRSGVDTKHQRHNL